VLDWVADVRNNAGRPFLVIDKKDAMLYAFDADTRLKAASPVLIGAVVGDDPVEMYGRHALDTPPEERTTPAGRFIAERGRNMRGEDVVWIDYDNAVSIHRVITSRPDERRLERLETTTPADNRVSYGCINVPADFYEANVKPLFAVYPAIVYVLPEV